MVASPCFEIPVSICSSCDQWLPHPGKHMQKLRVSKQLEKNRVARGNGFCFDQRGCVILFLNLYVII